MFKVLTRLRITLQSLNEMRLLCFLFILLSLGMLSEFEKEDKPWLSSPAMYLNCQII